MKSQGFVVQNTNRFTAAVRKLLSIKGEERDVGFGVHLEDERPEYSFLKGEYLFCQTHELTVGAGAIARVGIINPVGGTSIVVINSVFAQTDVLTPLQLGWGPAAALNPDGNVRMRDLRWALGSARASMSGIQYGSNNLGVTGFNGIWTQLTPQVATQPIDFTAAGGRVGPVVIPPGYAAYLASTAVGAIVLRGTFNGYERPLESGELQA